MLQAYQGIPQYQTLSALPEATVPVGNARGHGYMGEEGDAEGKGRAHCSL